MSNDIKIECPKCGWEPDGGAYWSCTCGHIWNTFATDARCPACNKQWKHTQCIAYKGGCNQFSLHLDWYKGLDDWLEDELEAAGIQPLTQPIPPFSSICPIFDPCPE